jgi:hypothetical protein
MPDEGYITIQVGGPRAKRQGVALVDRADGEAVEAYRWCMHDNGYAVRNAQVGGKRRIVRMHREILGLGPGDPGVDHVNGDRLDNRRGNLRIATNAQNLQNRHQCGPYRGASWDAERNRWQARVQLDGKTHHLGRHATEAEAAAVSAAWRREHMPFSSDAREAPA